MHPDTREIAQHMRKFGLSVLSRAVYDVTFCEVSKPFAHAMAVGHAAHGAEILLKARIAEEHPLLIFTSLPKSTSVDGTLSIRELLGSGRTIMFNELPEVLWAATGVRVPKANNFLSFGRLRNSIIHFSVPNVDLSGETLKFIFGSIEPLVQDFWNESIVNHVSIWDEVIVTEGYLQECLARHQVDLPATTKALLDRHSDGA